MKKAQLLRRLKRVKTLTRFLSFRGKSDRECAIGNAAVLEAILEALLRRTFRRDIPDEMFSGYGPLASFAAKIDVAFAMGGISAGERAELHKMRKIRNECAHSLAPTLRFDKPPLEDWIRDLRLSASAITGKKTSLRRDFEVAVLVLAGFLIGAHKRRRGPRIGLDPVVGIARLSSSGK